MTITRLSAKISYLAIPPVFTACVLTFLLASPERAAAGKREPSPFTGSYSGQVGPAVIGLGLDISISSDGRVSGRWRRGLGGGTVSGRVTDAGDMRLGLQVINGGGRKGRKVPVAHANAVVSLDADGNLVGLWLSDSDGAVPIPFVLTRISEF